MGYVQTLRRPWLILDLETTAIDDLDQFADDLRIDSRLKDPAKVAEARAAARERAALDLDLARIVCAGLWESDYSTPAALLAETPFTERDIIHAAWLAIARCLESGGLLVTYNGLGYDLPLLMRRAQYLDVPFKPIELNKFRPGPVLDLQNVLSFSGLKPFRSLDFYARRFGLGIDDDIDGGDMPALISAGDWDAVRRHNLADLRRTQALAQRLRYIGPPAAQEAA